MDGNTFAILLLALGTVIICVIVWQVFSVARARAKANATVHDRERADQLGTKQQQLDQRLTSLAEDVRDLERRVGELERPALSDRR